MKKLIDFLQKGTCAATVVREMEQRFQEAGFEKLSLSEAWNLTEGGAYYVVIHETSCLAFRVGEGRRQAPFFRLVSAHTDQPGFRLKPEPELEKGHSGKLNVSVYGGPIYSTWLDRPLSLAGKVAVRSQHLFETDVRVVDLTRPLLVIPNLAIHMNREVNRGVELNPQVDMQPLAGLDLSEHFVREAL